MGTTIEEIVIEKMRVLQPGRELAKAMFLGTRIETLLPQDIKETTDEIVNIMCVYFGVDSVPYKSLKEILPMEVKGYYKQYTIQELKLGFNRALRNDYGTYYGKTPSLKLFRDLISLYAADHGRSDIKKEFTQCRLQMQPSDYMSDEEKQKRTMEAILYKFGRYKAGDETMLDGSTYDCLIAYAAMPDYTENLIQAAVKVSAEKKEFRAKQDGEGNTIPLGEAIKKLFTSTAETEAKRMALKSVYDKLIAGGKSLEEFIGYK